MKTQIEQQKLYKKERRKKQAVREGNIDSKRNYKTRMKLIGICDSQNRIRGKKQTIKKNEN